MSVHHRWNLRNTGFNFLKKLIYDPNKHHRLSIRLKNYDYSQLGAYFITLGTHNRKPLLGDIVKGKIELSEIGKIAKKFWLEIPNHFEKVKPDRLVIMPNHIYAIIMVGVQYIEPLRRHRYQHLISKSIGSVIRSYKASVTRWCRNNGFGYFQWQKNYYERVIRNETELNAIRQYILYNPLKWSLDKENPDSINYDLDYQTYFEQALTDYTNSAL